MTTPEERARQTMDCLDPVNQVCITTIQRLYSMLRGK